MIALAANLLAWFSHQCPLRLTDSWSTYLFYAGRAVMLAVSVWNILMSMNKGCDLSTETKP